MAGEITRTNQIAIANGNFIVPKRGTANVPINQAVAGGGGPGMVNVPTTAGGTQYTVPAACYGGWCYIKNTDAVGSTNTLEYGSWISGALQVPHFGLLLPGEEVSFRLGATTPTFAAIGIGGIIPAIIEFYNA